MRTATTLTIALGITLFAPIGSGGTGTMTPQANHVDRHLFATGDMRSLDLSTVDTAVAVAVMQPHLARARAQD